MTVREASSAPFELSSRSHSPARMSSFLLAHEREGIAAIINHLLGDDHSSARVEDVHKTTDDFIRHVRGQLRASRAAITPATVATPAGTVLHNSTPMVIDETTDIKSPPSSIATSAPSIPVRPRTPECTSADEEGELEPLPEHSAGWQPTMDQLNSSLENGDTPPSESFQDTLLHRVGITTAFKHLLLCNCIDIRTATTLASICRLLRSMTLDTPQAWTVISNLSRQGMEQLAVIIGRSAQLPLFLDLTLKPHETATTWIAIARSVPRCLSLSIRLSEVTTTQAASFIRLFSDVPATRLRHLRLETANAPQLVLPGRLFETDAPRLREIQLRLSLLPADCPALRSVTTLIALDEVMPVTVVQRAFALCPKLRHLRMEGVIPVAAVEEAALTTLVSLHIAETNLDGRTTQIVPFLRTLHHEGIEEIRVARVRIESLKFVCKTMFGIREFGFLRKIEDDQATATTSANTSTSAHLLLEDEMHHLRIFSPVMAPHDLEISSFFQTHMCSTLVRLTLGDRLLARDVEALQIHSRSLIALRHVKLIFLKRIPETFEKGSIHLVDLATRQSSASRWDVPRLRTIGITSVNPFDADIAFRGSPQATVSVAARSLVSLVTWFSKNGPPDRLVLEAIKVHGDMDQVLSLVGTVVVH